MKMRPLVLPRSISPRASLVKSVYYYHFFVLAFLFGLYVGRNLSWNHSHTSTSSFFSSNDHRDSKGWRTLDVYIGIQPNTTQQWHSQARQDEIVAALLQHKRYGYFIDLAANDALELSNTAALESRFGWSGLCIEPNPVYWYNLTHARSCQVVGAVVGAKRDERVDFRFTAGDHGGIIGFDNGARWRKEATSVYTVTLLEIFNRYQAPHEIDYLSLDVEGAEAFIMMQFPLDRYRIKVITAERLRGEIRAYLKSFGYEFVTRITRWGESLWVHESIRNELDMKALEQFDFPIL